MKIKMKIKLLIVAATILFIAIILNIVQHILIGGFRF